MNKKSLHFAPGMTLFLGLALISSAELKAASKDAPAKAAARTAPNIRPVPDVALPQSVFVIPSQPSEGRNPFFPQSMAPVPAAKVTKESPLQSFTLVLNGITSPPKRTAMINGRTFETGEEGEVRLPSGGRLLIKCEEIKADSAIIFVDGQRRELRLRSGF